MGILSWLRSRKKNKSEATSILISLGCINGQTNGITPSMCNEGVIRSIIDTSRKQGKTQTANDLESWLNLNRKRIM